MPVADYYEILQVSEHAELEVIQAAYKRLAFKYHPDRNHPDADQKMRLLNEAYEILSDSDRRRAYDTERKQATGANGQQTTTAQEVRPETVKVVEQVYQYINLLLDRRESILRITEQLMTMGCPDRRLAAKMVRDVLSDRLTMVFPAHGAQIQGEPSPDQLQQIDQLREYASLLLDWGESVPVVIENVMMPGLGLNRELAETLVSQALASREASRQSAQQSPAGSPIDAVAILTAVAKRVFPPVEPCQRYLWDGVGVGALAWSINFLTRKEYSAFLFLAPVVLWTAIGACYALSRAHRQYREGLNNPQSGILPWDALQIKSHLIRRWVGFFALLALLELGAGIPLILHITHQRDALRGSAEIYNHTNTARVHLNNRKYDEAIQEYTHAIGLIEKLEN